MILTHYDELVFNFWIEIHLNMFWGALSKKCQGDWYQNELNMKFLKRKP